MRHVAVLLIAVAGCGGGTSGDDGPGDDAGGDARLVDGSAVTRVVVEVDYATGAEPYTGNILAFGDAWDLTVGNLDRLYSGHRTLVVPRTLGAMEAIGAVADPSLTVTELLALADLHRDQHSAGDTVAYYVLFVDSRFEDAGGTQNGVLGVSLGSTGVIAMFKPVIRSTASVTFPNLEKFVEQSVMIHELGHAVGLVNNGIPLTTAHQDVPHGAHCTSQSCVMFWQNDGVTDAVAFARQYVVSGSSILFGPECLADADAVFGGP